MKAKTNMEGKYVKKCAEVTVSQTKKRCNMSEQDDREQIQVSQCTKVTNKSRSPFGLDLVTDSNLKMGKSLRAAHFVSLGNKVQFVF